MNNNLLELIKNLTDKDKKNLSQKTVKLLEESGELAKSVLPYEMASGSLHRFTYKEKLLEDSTDVMLVALSIIYSLGYNDNDITDMMQKKALYWSQIQDNENVDVNKIPHEIHITVSDVIDLEKFKEDCRDLGLKAIVLDLHVTDGVIKDIMTSSVKVGNSNEAYDLMIQDKANLETRGYKVVRGKIEVAPWHPIVPKQADTRHVGHGQYFESHIEVYIDNHSETHTLEAMKALMKDEDVHVSNNFFKRNADVSNIMLTYRQSNANVCFEGFRDDTQHIRELLTAGGFLVNKKNIIEYSMYDSNVDHDKIWIKSQ